MTGQAIRGVLVTVALAAVIVGGALLASRGEDERAIPTAPAWGSECAITVTPADGASADDATDRALTVLRSRAAAFGWTAYAFDAVAPGRIGARVEASLCAEDLADLVATVDASVVRDGSTIVAPADIRGASWNGRRLRLDLSPAGRKAVQAADPALAQTLVVRRRDTVSTLGSLDPRSLEVDLGVVSDEAGRAIALSLAGGGQADALALSGSTRFGTPPALVGTAVPEAPQWIRTSQPPPQPGDLRVVVDGAHDGRSLYAARTADGPSVTDWIWLSGPDATPGDPPLPCGPFAGTPLVATCPLPDDAREVTVGRVAPHVQRLELQLFGGLVRQGRTPMYALERLPARMSNGWFVAPPATPGGWQRSLVAYGDRGQEIGRLQLPAVAPALTEH